VENYRNRISGPRLDRIGIHVEAPAVEYKELSSDEQPESAQAIRERVLAARKLKQERFAAKPKSRANAEMTHGLPKANCKLNLEGRELLHRAMEGLHLSGRAYDRILKVARTIADCRQQGYSACACLRSDPISYLGSQPWH
jgi:magnesium chelatase family protein